MTNYTLISVFSEQSKKTVVSFPDQLVTPFVLSLICYTVFPAVIYAKLGNTMRDQSFPSFDNVDETCHSLSFVFLCFFMVSVILIIYTRVKLATDLFAELSAKKDEALEGASLKVISATWLLVITPSLALGSWKVPLINLIFYSSALFGTPLGMILPFWLRRNFHKKHNQLTNMIWYATLMWISIVLYIFLLAGVFVDLFWL